MNEEKTMKYIADLLIRITELEEINKQHQELNGTLRNENERLKERLLQEKKDFKETNDYAFKLLDYKSRCEKAIEYIQNNMQYDDNIDDNWVMTNDLLNILQDKEVV